MPDTRVTDSILCLATRNWWEKWCVGRKAPLSFHHCLAASALSSLSLLHGIWFSDHGILSTLDWLIWLAYERQEMGYHCCLLRYTILVYVLCLYDVKLYLGKRVDMLTVRMKSIWISFDCDQASHSAVVLWDVQWAEAPHADAQRNHPLHPSPPRITRLKRPFSPMFGACHPSKPKNSSFHITRTVMYLFPKLHREFRRISRWRHGDVKQNTIDNIHGVQQWIKKSTEVQGLRRRQLYSLNLL